MFSDDRDREQFFEAAIVQAQKEHQEDSTNVQALIHWGGALMELAHYKQGDEALQCIQDAIDKLKHALRMDDSHAQAHWYLGNAYTSLGFLQKDKAEALEFFGQAKEVFQAGRDKDPSNETYAKALDLCDKAPLFYDEIQSELQKSEEASGQGGGKPGARRGSGAGGGSQGDLLGISDFWWDAAGWVLLVGIISGIALLSRSGAGPSGAPPSKA